ncbi:MAG TPA: M36 family metallopeptidase [Mycobacteriales bacterium]|nr:M36 family metallopeptidase [Mycobacteriales bacterium]
MLSRRALLPACALVLTGLAAVGLPSQAVAPAPTQVLRGLAGPDSGDFPGAQVALGDADRRGPRLAPRAQALGHLRAMGAGLQVSWTQYGTPLNLTRDHDFLASGIAGGPEQVARTYLARHAALWGLSARDVARLRTIVNEPMPQSHDAWSVSFNQVVDGMLVSQDGYVTVGVKGDKVALVTSSLVPTALLGSLPSATPSVSLERAVLAAAHDAGVTGLRLPDLRLGKVDGAGFRLVSARGLHQPQRARLRVLPTTDRGARLVWEVDVLDVTGSNALGTMSYVDAVTGGVLLRRDAVDTFAEGTAGIPAYRSVGSAGGTPSAFQGTYTATSCSSTIPLDGVAAGDINLAIAVAAAVPANDITIKLFRNGKQFGFVDTLASPEAGTLAIRPPASAKDTFTAKVCPFDNASKAPFSFAGSYGSTDQAVSAPPLPGPAAGGQELGPATWRVFGSNPQLARNGVVSKDDRYRACSGAVAPADNPLQKELRDCQFVWNDGSRVPYDVNPVTGLPTFTTLGNNALTTNAQGSTSLTPGAPLLPPVSPTRDYAPPFTDAWHTSQCDPVSLLTPARADIDAAVVNLFVGHNRVHDFSYRLGLTEKRGALQVSNYGQSGPEVAEGDPELGNAQNGALQGGQGLGRDNANQLTFQDGVPGITNQYLFQPVVGFASPCTDGDLDGAVFLHEFTHATSNRLIAGPATSLSGKQGGSMGESWSDLTAIEYMNAFGLAGGRGEHPYSMGAYVTGNSFRGIRDFNALPQNNPLNYGDMGFDATGPEVHADGEIWNAVQMTVRQALVARWDKKYPSKDRALQIACAVGRYPSGAKAPAWNHCPGNRRYITYQYDAMILQANGAPSMVDMKNVELAAVLMRDRGDYDTVADAFASRGLGKGASSGGSDDTDPTPSFASPVATHNGKVTFALKDARTGKAVHGSVFVGVFTARCTPVATTLGGDEPKATQAMLKGRYTVTVQAKGYGIQRFGLTVRPGAQTAVLKLRQNVASAAFGSGVSGNAGGLRLGRVIDDNEGTNAAFDGQPVKGRSITVAFGPGKVSFDRFAVSSLHHPAQDLPEGGTEIESRLLGIRAFDLQVSRDGGRTFTTVYRSPNDFFPARRPRAVAPDLLLRTVTLPHAVTGNAVRLVIRSNTCTGGSDFNYEQDRDLTSPSDCRSDAVNTTQVTVTELQVFRS